MPTADGQEDAIIWERSPLTLNFPCTTYHLITSFGNAERKQSSIMKYSKVGLFDQHNKNIKKWQKTV